MWVECFFLKNYLTTCIRLFWYLLWNLPFSIIFYIIRARKKANIPYTGWLVCVRSKSSAVTQRGYVSLAPDNLLEQSPVLRGLTPQTEPYKTEPRNSCERYTAESSRTPSCLRGHKRGAVKKATSRCTSTNVADWKDDALHVSVSKR